VIYLAILTTVPYAFWPVVGFFALHAIVLIIKNVADLRHGNYTTCCGFLTSFHVNPGIFIGFIPLLTCVLELLYIVRVLTQYKDLDGGLNDQ
jgi:hypothetical protein